MIFLCHGERSFQTPSTLHHVPVNRYLEGGIKIYIFLKKKCLAFLCYRHEQKRHRTCCDHPRAIPGEYQMSHTQQSLHRTALGDRLHGNGPAAILFSASAPVPTCVPAEVGLGECVQQPELTAASHAAAAGAVLPCVALQRLLLQLHAHAPTQPHSQSHPQCNQWQSIVRTP